jgi:hypothetical protein
VLRRCSRGRARRPLDARVRVADGAGMFTIGRAAAELFHHCGLSAVNSGARHKVDIGEVSGVSHGQVPRGEPTPEIRSVFWRGEAADESAAQEAGWRAWDQKYGAARQPVDALVKVMSVAA